LKNSLYLWVLALSVFAVAATMLHTLVVSVPAVADMV